ncbi:hypothetical protein CBR_g48647 [Chara braunii]|uniref:Uncharacterized protein n=1 Tax=Chara braunii TaxID=69332 RepID=A0A388M3J1_CHABU|nr:hypothetical protein CBR_g48647 [Chara braunii]|eukprot:GBG89039.1 hypothetical protein CBR_g48647 [Chara braunii]
MDDYPMYGVLVGFSLWGTLWRLLFPLGFWNTFTCRVETRGGVSTTPYTPEQEEEAARTLAEQKARTKKEVVKQAKKLSLLQEQAVKKKKLEEELKRLKEEEEKLKAEEEKEEEEEKKVEKELPLIRRSIRERGETSGTKKEDSSLEKKVFEWVANVSLGEEEKPMLYVPREEQEAVVKELEAEEDPLKQQTIEEEKKLLWKLRLTRERKKRMEAASKAAKELEEVKQQRVQMEAQADLQGKMEAMARNIERLAQAQEEQYQFGRSQDMVVRSIQLGFREFAREMLMHVGSEVQTRLEGTMRFCTGAIEGAKLAAPREEEARPRREPVKVKFPDSYSGRKEENFDNWEANVSSYVHLQRISPDEHVLIAFHALRDEAASFARSLCHAAKCDNNMVAYSAITPLIGQLVLPCHAPVLRGHFFEKNTESTMTYDTLSREVVAYEVQSMSVSTFWHKDLDKGKKWKGHTISGQVKSKDHLILTLDEGGMEEVPYDKIEWGLEEDDGSLGQARTYATVAAGGRPQGRGRGQGQEGRASGGRGQGDQGVGGRGDRQAGGRGQGPSQNRSRYTRSPPGRGGWHPDLPQGRREDLDLEQIVWQRRIDQDQCIYYGDPGHIIKYCPKNREARFVAQAAKGNRR